MNECLTHLDLSFNAVTPAAAMVLANAFKTNATLLRLELAGNLLGKRGAESLLAAMRRAQTTDRYLNISIGNCDVDAIVPGLFDPIEPTGHYDLDMSTPYNFVSTCDIIGGNSGSPVLDADGNFVAINFDRQRLGLMNEFKWSREYSRSIGTDVRYMLLLIGKYDGAQWLVDEMVG